jgi:serine/threonine-protein kinase
VVAEEERRSRIWPWILVLVFLLLLGGAVYALFRSNETPLVDVPSVIGQTEEEARNELEALEFVMVVAEERLPSDEIPEGSVVEQQPDEGTKLEENGEVTVTLSSGPEENEVPDVTGRTLDQAATILGNAGFTVDSQPQEEPSDEFEEGQITRQDPEAGATAAEGTVIELWVSTGPAVRTVDVPDLVGRSEETAVALLEEANLVPDRRLSDSDEEEGTVIEQNPAPGSEVAEGSAVTIVVSAGPGQVQVPDVVGDSRQEAEVTLGQAGLRVAIGQEVPDESPAGTVIDQDPAGGQEVDPGSTVTLVLSAGPETTTTAPPTTIGPPGAAEGASRGSSGRVTGKKDDKD